MKQITHMVVAFCLATALVMANEDVAEARGGGGGGGGGAYYGLGFLDALKPKDEWSTPASCYKGPPECEIVARRCYSNADGDRVCAAPKRRCFRRQICE